MIKDSLVLSWESLILSLEKMGFLKTERDIFLCEIGLCMNQQLKIDKNLRFVPNDVVKIADKNLLQLKKLKGGQND